MRGTQTDLILQYGKDKGHGFDTASRHAMSCDVDYVDWLEERVKQLQDLVEALATQP